MQSLIDHRVVHLLVHERESRLRGAYLLDDGDRSRRRLRRWLGRLLVRVGERLAGEPTMRPARAR